jgi:hypothetical protein
MFNNERAVCQSEVAQVVEWWKVCLVSLPHSEQIGLVYLAELAF